MQRVCGRRLEIEMFVELPSRVVFRMHSNSSYPCDICRVHGAHERILEQAGANTLALAFHMSGKPR